MSRSLPFSLQGCIFFFLFALLIMCVSCGANLDGIVDAGVGISDDKNSNDGKDGSSEIPAKDGDDVNDDDSPEVADAKRGSYQCRQYGFNDGRFGRLDLVSKTTIKISEIRIHAERSLTLRFNSPQAVDLVKLGEDVSNLLSTISLPKGRIYGFTLKVASSSIVLKNESMWKPGISESAKLEIPDGQIQIVLNDNYCAKGGRDSQFRIRLQTKCNLVHKGNFNGSVVKGFFLIPLFFGQLDR